MTNQTQFANICNFKVLTLLLPASDKTPGQNGKNSPSQTAILSQLKSLKTKPISKWLCTHVSGPDSFQSPILTDLTGYVSIVTKRIC